MADLGSVWNEVIIVCLLNLSHYLAGGYWEKWRKYVRIAGRWSKFGNRDLQTWSRIATKSGVAFGYVSLYHEHQRARALLNEYRIQGTKGLP